MTKEEIAVEETAEDKAKTEALTKRASELQEQMTNRHKREAVKFFGADFDALDGLDTMVVLAWIADPSLSLEDYDNMPLGELQKAILN